QAALARHMNTYFRRLPPSLVQLVFYANTVGFSLGIPLARPFANRWDKKAAYMAKYSRPGTEGGFHFLTGDETSIAPLMQSIGFQYQYDPAIDQYAHPAMIAVLTPEGHISKYFMGIDFSARDLRFAMIDASHGHVGSAVERALITWCYHYDPTTGTYGLLTIRLVQAAGIALIVAMLVFWTVMWRRERGTAAA
ncbi:MAG: hypothetical protein ACJ8H8_08610, partial [Geminicoccaceae bacterium]